jgi:hypothetical protein
MYFLSFVEEGVMNPDYMGCVGGRIEVYKPDEVYADYEIRFITKEITRYSELREKYDFESVTEEELCNIKEIVKDIKFDLNGGDK